MLVFFCTRGSFRRFSIPWWVAFVTGSRYVHIAIGVGDVVLDPRVDGDFVWNGVEFAERYPSLAVVFEVPDPAAGIPTRATPRPIAPSVLRYLTWNAVPADDCVTVAVRALRSAGVRVPWYIRCPQGLHDYLEQRFDAQRIE